MQESEISKVEETIRTAIRNEMERSKLEVSNIANKECQKAIDRINGVYTSAINTLRQLGLKDATFLDIFEKTKGNVRVYEHVLSDYTNQIEVDVGGRRLGYDRNVQNMRVIQPIQLESRKLYKIVVMAIEETPEEQKNENIR